MCTRRMVCVCVCAGHVISLDGSLEAVLSALPNPELQTNILGRCGPNELRLTSDAGQNLFLK